MAAKTPGAAAATIALVVAIALAVVVVVVLSRHELSGPAAQPGPAPTAPRLSPQQPAGTPADRGTPPTQSNPPPTPTLPNPTSSVCVPQQESRRLTFLTFNIHSARAPDGSVHLGTIADELARWDPDVVLLQEVDRGRQWTDRLDMPSVLAKRLRMSWTFGANVRRSPTNQYGTAILSRFPIVSSRNVLLPAPPHTQQRGLLHAVVDADGVKISVYDTHLENTSLAARRMQMRRIASLLRGDRRPKVLGGDLNSRPDSAVAAAARSVVTDTWSQLRSGAGYTHPAGNPRIRIDYLFHGAGSHARVAPLRAEVLPSALSDHRPVEATYRITADLGQVCVPVLSGPSAPGSPRSGAR